MAWNEIAAKEDPDLSYQVYYLRLNALKALLTPLSASAFLVLWEQANNHETRSFIRSYLAGDLMADLIRALGLDEISRNSEIAVGEWFVHSGITTYKWGPRSGQGTARIELERGRCFIAAVRADCVVTNTARVNMQDRDDISLIVGRVISSNRFDLIAAGYREPSHLTVLRVDAASGTTRTWDLQGVRAPQQYFARTSADYTESRFRFVPLQSPEQLDVLIEDALEQFRILVEQRGAWRLLYNANGEPLHESTHHGLLRIIGRFTLEVAGAVVDPGADHGSGPTDFTVSAGGFKTVVEIKKDTSTRLEHGLKTQLLHYARAAGADSGWYVVMVHSATRDIEQLRKRLTGIAADLPLPVLVRVIDCRRRKSASTA